MKEIFSLSYLPLTIRLNCLEETALPPYLGSTLRGIVGWALRPHKNAYQYLYENSRVDHVNQVTVNPYVLETPQYQNIYRRGDELRFQIILIGDGMLYAEELVQALSETRVFGLGAARRKFEITEIMHAQNLRSIWTPERCECHTMTPMQLSCGSQENSMHCSVQFLTPLRIRRGGELVTKIDFTTMIRSITRRLTELTERYGGWVDCDEIDRIISGAEKLMWLWIVCIPIL